MNITQSAGQYTIKNHNPFSLQRLESVPNRCALHYQADPQQESCIAHYVLDFQCRGRGCDDCMKTTFRGHCPVLHTRHFLRWWRWCYHFCSARGAMLKCVGVIALKCPLTCNALLSCCMRCVQKMIISLWGLPLNPLVVPLCQPQCAMTSHLWWS